MKLILSGRFDDCLVNGSRLTFHKFEGYHYYHWQEGSRVFLLLKLKIQAIQVGVIGINILFYL